MNETETKDEYKFVIKDLKLRVKSRSELAPNEHYRLYKLRVIDGNNKYFSWLDLRGSELRIFMNFLDRSGLIDPRAADPRNLINDGEVA